MVTRYKKFYFRDICGSMSNLIALVGVEESCTFPCQHVSRVQIVKDKKCYKIFFEVSNMIKRKATLG